MDLEIQNLKNYIMHQKISQNEISKITNKIVSACRIDDYIKDDVKDDIQEILHEHLDSSYCKTCGSCGESGCYNPSDCETVKCLDGDSNTEDYKDLLDENEDYRNRIQAMKEIFSIINNKLHISKDMINEIMELLTVK